MLVAAVVVVVVVIVVVVRVVSKWWLSACELIKTPNKLLVPPLLLFQEKKPIAGPSTGKTVKVGAFQ